MYCGNCGFEIRNGEKRCPRCGMDTWAPDYTKRGSDRGNYNVVGILLVIICILLIAGLIICFLFLSQARNSNETVNTEKYVVVDEYADEEKSEKEYPEVPEFQTITASSALPNALGYTYYPENVMDGNVKTAWNEGASKEGLGETLTFEADEEQLVRGVKILNGYCQDQKTYNNNNRVKSLRIWFSNGESFDYILHDVFGEYTNIEFNEGKVCDTVVFTIMDVYKGAKFEDTCISEIEFY